MDQYLFGKDLYQRKAASLLLNCIFLQEGRTLTALALQKGLCSASNDEELSSVLLLIKDVEMWMPEVRIRDQSIFIEFEVFSLRLMGKTYRTKVSNIAYDFVIMIIISFHLYFHYRWFVWLFSFVFVPKSKELNFCQTLERSCIIKTKPLLAT